MGKLNINNGGVDTNKKMPDIDERFGPYTSKEAADAALGGQGRNTITAGLTVGILTANAGVKEWWYQPNKKTGQLELIPKGGNAADNPTEGNFASFDENGNVVDSGNKADDFAPMEQAVPMGDEDDEGKILEKQANGFGWVDKPVDGLTPEIDPTTKKWKIGENLTETYAEGKSALQLYNETYNKHLTQAQFVEEIKANYPMAYVGYNSAAAGQSIGTPFESIGNLIASEATMGKMYLMPNADPEGETEPDGSILFVTVQTEETTYRWYNMGDLDVPSNALTKEMVDNECANGTVDTPASAKAVMELKSNLHGTDYKETKVVDLDEWHPTNKTSGFYLPNGNWNNNTNYKSTSIDVLGYDYVRFHGYALSSERTITYAFLDENEDLVDGYPKPYIGDGTSPNVIPWEYFIKIPSDAKYLVALIKKYNDAVVQESNFYCYKGNGNTVKDLIPIVIDDLKSNSSKDALSANQGMNIASSLMIEELFGANNNIVYSTIKRVIPGHKYRVNLRNPNIAKDNVEYTTSEYTIFAIAASANMADFVNLVQIGADRISESFFDYYDVEIPSDKYYIRIAMRTNEGDVQVFEIEDITTIQSISTEVLVNNRSVVFNTSDFVQGEILNDNTWEVRSNYYHIAIPVKKGSKIIVTPYYNTTSRVAFLPLNYQVVDGASVVFDGGTSKFYKSSEKIRLVAPEDCNLYVQIGSRYRSNISNPYPWTPRKIEISEPDVDVDETWVEASMFKRSTNEIINSSGAVDGSSNANNCVKYYNIDSGRRYRLIAENNSSQSSSSYLIAYYDSNRTFLGGILNTHDDDVPTIMEDDLEIPANTVYCVVACISDVNSGTWKGCAMLMTPADGKARDYKSGNQNIYHVTKIRKGFIPNEYTNPDGGVDQHEDITQETWSAWAIRLPDSYRNSGKKTQLVAWFHGTNGFVNDIVMGYKSWDTSVHKKLLDAGFAVMDIHGYGVGFRNDETSQHWGCPEAIETVKKAFEYLKSTYNICDKMILGGLSMGGAICTTYAKTYPSDVISIGVMAPTNLLFTCLWQGGGESSYIHYTGVAWGYEGIEAMRADNASHIVGYAPLAVPYYVDENNVVKKMTEFPSTALAFRSNNLVEPFPVPMKIWHSENDTNVPFTRTQCLVDSIRRAGGNAMVRKITGELSDSYHDLPLYPYIMDEVIEYYKSISNQ